jgi:hypothetical protein
MKENRIFANIYLKHSRGPLAKGLDGGWRHSSFSEGSCTARTERVASIIFWEKATELSDKPMPSGDGALGGEPKFGMDGEEVIT